MIDVKQESNILLSLMADASKGFKEYLWECHIGYQIYHEHHLLAARMNLLSNMVIIKLKLTHKETENAEII